MGVSFEALARRRGYGGRRTGPNGTQQQSQQHFQAREIVCLYIYTAVQSRRKEKINLIFLIDKSTQTNKQTK
jgi:hypothetical protein